MQWMPFMLKITIFTSLLLTVILHIVVEAEGNNSSNNNLIVDTRSISIYQSLYSAIEMDSANEVKQFIAFGADINHRYEDEKTPLMLASNMGSIDAIHALLELGANPDLVSVENMTAMDYAKKMVII
jgi:ankyrin repeat protein